MQSKRFQKTLSLLTAFALVLSIIATVPVMQANAATVEIPIANGDFETGAFDGVISGSNGAAIVEKTAYEGIHSLKLDALSGTGEMITVTGYYPQATTEETTVTLSFWAKAVDTAPENSRVHYGMFATNASWGNRVQKYGAGAVAPSNGWVQISDTLTVPADTKIIQAQVYIGDNTGVIALIDNASITDANGNELLTGGGFEAGASTENAKYSESVELITSVPVHSGNYAAHVDKSAGNGTVQATVSITPSAEARTVTLSYWMYAPGATGRGLHNGVFCFDTSSGSWNLLSEKYNAAWGATGQWEHKTLPIEVPANTNTLQIRLYAQEENANIYIDDLVLTEEVAVVNHDITLNFNGVSGDNTWQFTPSVTPANQYYKVPAIIDGTQYNVLAGMSGSVLCIYPNFMTALGAPTPTSTFVIEAGTVLKAADSTTNWAEIADAETLTVTEEINLSYVNGAWSKTVHNQDITLHFNGVSGDNTWQFTPSVTPANQYYKVPAIIDGTQYNVLAGMSGSVLCIYPNFMTALGAPTPTSTFVIEAGTVLKAADSAANWAEIADAETLTVTEEINLSNAGGVWGVTVATTPLNLSIIAVVADGTWQLDVSPIPDQKYYKIPALIDGTQYNILAGMTVLDGENILCIYPNFFTALGGKAPTASVVIPQGTVIKAADPTNNWAEIANTTVYALENAFALYVNCDGSWDTTVEAHVYNQQNTALEGALVSAATCQSAATYYYSCACGEIGTETFTAGELGGHNYVNGACDFCGDVVSSITLAYYGVAPGGTWQLTPSASLGAAYYRLSVVVDGQSCEILAGYNNAQLIIYPNFFTALGGKAPTETLLIPAGTVLTPADSTGDWAPVEGGQSLLVEKELKVDNVVGTWADMSLYADTEIVDISSADLDVYYQHYLDAADYSDLQVNMVKDQYADLFNTYGRNGNMTTVGIKCTNANIAIPNDAKWANFTVLGTVTAEGASDQTPQDIYILMTPDSSSSESTAMTSAFLIRCYNGNVGEQAASITIHEGTILISKDGTKGFRFTEDFVILRSGESWSKRGATITSANLTLGGVLNLNVKATNATGCTLRATVGDSVQNISAANGVYTVILPAHRLHEDVTLELLSGETVVAAETWTMEGYAEALREAYASDAKLMTLLDAVDNYGTYAAYYADPTGTAPAIAEVEAVTREDLAAYRLTVTTRDESNLQPTAGLYLDDACDIRIKLNPEAFEGYKLWIDGTEVTTSTVDGKIFYEIANILPQDWAKMYNIKVEGEAEDDQWGMIFSLEDESNGGLDVVGTGNIFECNYSVLSYAYTQLGKTGEAQTGLNGLMKSMFLYSQAAGAYIAE